MVPHHIKRYISWYVTAEISIKEPPVILYYTQCSFVQGFCAFCLLISPFPLAEWGASSRDETAVVLVLLSVVLQEGVLVPVQIIHQVTVATVLSHQIERA